MYLKRIEKTRALLTKENLAALVVDKPIDLYYLTGEKISLGRLIVTPQEVILFVDGRYFDTCKKNKMLDVRKNRGYGPDSPFAKMWKWSGEKVAFDAAWTTYENYTQLTSLGSKLVPLANPIKELRKIKDSEEVEALRKAAELCAKGYDFATELVKEGITEEEFSIELELFWRKSGGNGLSFSPHIAFSENSAYPHYLPQKKELQKGDLILLDIGVKRGEYHSDMTRVLFFKESDPELEALYYIVRDAQAKALALCKPGTIIKKLDQVARDHITEAGYGDFFTHGLGHGVGLELHEFPLIRAETTEPLQEGMVITIEPGIYLPGKGGVRLEDTIVITPIGYENLTNRPLSKSIPVLN